MSIEDQIRNIIKNNSYITIDQMMQEALTAHIDSYYKKPNILGLKGDFITSPEISQLFGEMIGLWAIEQWQKLSCPKKLNLVELGPGRGLLMRDLLRTAKLVPAFYHSININLIEINPYLITEQKNNLTACDRPIKWLDNIRQLEQVPTIFIANEFFDALPIKQYKKENKLWHEIVIRFNDQSRQLYFDTIPITAKLQTELTTKYTQADNGAIAEESAESLDIITNIAKCLKFCSGSALVIDYGYNLAQNLRTKNQYNSTLQAVKNHRYYTAILKALGNADLSSHVDFYTLTERVKEQGIEAEQVISQNRFLTKYGIKLRIESLCQKLEQKEQDILRKQIERLISKNQMGELFKVMIFNNL